MRIAIVSDIHANLTALEAVIADLREQNPDLIVQGGDVVGGGPRPAEVIDRVRELGWPGVCGNTDEVLWMPERLAQTLQGAPFHWLRDVMATTIIPTTRAAIGEERLAWLQALPMQWTGHDVAVVHASPGDAWRSPSATASTGELAQTYGALGCRRVVFGHIHHAFVREVPPFTVINSGSVSLSYDGDPRAAYALIDGEHIKIRRVAYDVEEEIARLVELGDPLAEWSAQVLRTGRSAPLP